MNLLVDGNHLASRCRFSKVAQLATSDGRPSGIIYGFLQGLNYAAKMLKVAPENVIVVWDGGRSQSRMNLYPEYKRRKELTQEKKDELSVYYSQIDSLREVLPGLGVRDVRVLGTEADDVISILSNFDSRPVTVFSGDKDFHQLVSDRVSIFDPKKDLVTKKDILEKWGVKRATDILLLRALVGDTSDNIPGVPSIGEKRARMIVNRNGDDKVSTVEKYTKVCEENLEIIGRNLELMRLPKSSEEAGFSDEQKESLLEQVTKRGRRDTLAFVRFCQKWELKELLERFRW